MSDTDQLYGLRGLHDYLGEREGATFAAWRDAVVEAAAAVAALDRVKAAAELTPDMRKVAVDALYKARNDGKVMDDAAAEVATAVLRAVAALGETDA